MVKVGYLGPEGTFSAQAAQKWVKSVGLKNYILQPINSITYQISQVMEGKLNYSILPIENSVEGTVNIALDTLVKYEVLIVGEFVLPIEHCLAVKEAGIIQPEVVFSHPQALAQCYDYLAKNFTEISTVQVSSTGEAARMVAEGPLGWAAICSKNAAERYGLYIMAQNIQDYAGNKTRFLVIGKDSPQPTGNDKTSLVIALPQNQPGGLYRILHSFAVENINLTKIESRPTKRELGEYLFYIDCEGHQQDSKLFKVIEKLKQNAVFLKVLGSYPADRGMR
ncbi:prephenate dehydratase [Bacillota bacterium LX-D]|nr:prephenate dehydratase [Bacillota bacterium LX-D]